MKLKSILKTLATVAGTVHPGVGAAIGIVNQFLPSAQQLPDSATGAQVTQAYDTMSPGQQAAADNQLAHELGMEQENTKQLDALLRHDSSGKSTRPHIAMVSCYVCAITALGFLVLLFTNSKVPDWTVIAAVLAPFILWVNTYMNARTKEKCTRYAVAHGQSASLSGLATLVGGLFKK